MTNNRPHGAPVTAACYSSVSKNCFIVILDPQIQHIQTRKSNKSVFINILTTEGHVTIGCQYSPPSSDIKEDLAEWSELKGMSPKLLVLADLNAHSPLWGYPNDDDRGQHLINHMHATKTLIINNPYCSPTFQTKHLKGWPDVSLSSLQLFPRVHHWEVKEQMDYGDHRLITTILQVEIPRLPKRRYRTKNTSFKEFNKTLAGKIEEQNITFTNIDRKEEFDTEYCKFFEALKSTCEKHLQKRKNSHAPTTTWWTNELRRQRNYVRALRNKTKLPEATIESYTIFKKERAKYRKDIQEAKKKAWANFCQKTKNPYGKLKKMAFEEFFQQEIYALSSSQSAIHTKQNFYQELTNEIFGESTLNPPFKTNQDTTAPPITKQELSQAIYAFNKNKAPGIDEIDHIIIRNLFNNQQQLLLNMYNTLTKLNYFPDKWKIGEVVYFHKKGKPVDEPSSYRPITLLPIFGKILEKIILRRINYELSKEPSTFNSQHGFLEGRSTETALQDLFSQLDIIKQEDVYISLLSIDFQNAFDNLPWIITIELIKKLKIHPAYKNLLCSFLSTRGIYPNWLSRLIHWLFKGCPQGSCLGPFLWRIFIQQLIEILREKGFRVIAFADDLLLIITGRSRLSIEQNGREALNIISEWSQINQMKISYPKCQVLNLTKPKYSKKRPPCYKIDGHSLKTEPTLPYLGILLDSTLSFLPHLRQKRQELTQIIQNLLKFSTKKGSISKTIFKIWYQTILEKKISYAASVWFDKLQKAHGLRLLSAIQTQCLLLITSAYKKSPTIALCQLAGIPPLDLKLQQISSAGKILRLGIPINNHLPFMYHNKAIKSNICPYKKYLKSIDDLQQAQPIDIFTDGSKTDEGTGLAFCAFQQQQQLQQYQLKINQENSIFQAELVAIHKAIKWANQNDNKDFIIHTDCQSGIRAIEDNSSSIPLVQQIIQDLQNTEKTIILHWVRGHTGLHGNELADALAKTSITEENINYEFHPFPPSHIKRILKQQLLDQWQLVWDYDPRGRFAHRLLPKVSENHLLHHRNLYLFATNHGPFPSYLVTFGKAISKRCTCGQIGTSLHYMTSCTLTSTYHLRYSRNITLSSWFKTIISQPILLSKIINCISLIENNQLLFHMPPLHLIDDDDDD